MSEVKTSKVTNIQSLGNKGAYYVWEVAFENGDLAEMFKKNNNPWIEEGQEVEYTLRPARNEIDLPGLNVKKKVGFSAGGDSKNYSFGGPLKRPPFVTPGIGIMTAQHKARREFRKMY